MQQHVCNFKLIWYMHPAYEDTETKLYTKFPDWITIITKSRILFGNSGIDEIFRYYLEQSSNFISPLFLKKVSGGGKLTTCLLQQ